MRFDKLALILATGFVITLHAELAVAGTIGAIGPVIATIPQGLSETVADPSRNVVYALVNSTNTVEALSTSTFSVLGSVTLPGKPLDLVVGPGGNALYAVDQSNKSIDVINTQTMNLTKSIGLSGHPTDVAVGAANQLYTLVSQPDFTFQLQTVNPSTGSASAVPNNILFGTASYLRLSPDQETLYCLEQGNVPSRVLAINISANPATEVYARNAVQNGTGFALSPDGSLIAAIGGGGQSPELSGPSYSVPVFRSSDFSYLGYLPVGAYPNDVVFSPNDAIMYACSDATGGYLGAYNSRTLQLLGSVTEVYPTGASSLCLDNTGHELFVNTTGSTTLVYGVPEPDGVTLILIGAFFAAVARAGHVLRKPSRTSAIG